MLKIARHDSSLVGNWWWTIDRITLMIFMILMMVGVLMIFTTGPLISHRIHASHYFFIHKELLFIFPSMLLMVIVSFMDIRLIKRLCLIGFVAIIILLVLTKLYGVHIKGAQRWIMLMGVTLQPSEFAKPIFIILSASLITAQRSGVAIPGYFLSFVCYFTLVTLFIIQPDFGQSLLLSALWVTQLFMAGLPLMYIIVCIFLGAFSIIIAYFTATHVQVRIDAFLNDKNYQASQALHAFIHGGLLGSNQEPLKYIIPDGHADFVFAIMGEKFGAIACLLVVVLFVVVIIRSTKRLLEHKNLFTLNAGASFIVLFCLQALINMASNLSLIPTKGMTLPFISYGGSATISMGISMGILLALTRNKPQTQEHYF